MTATPKDLIRKYGIRPRKGLGQSFLIDLNVLDKIVRTAGIGGDDTVVEIGAGLGVMTARIAGKARKVVALEIDRTMTAALRGELERFPNVEIVETDVLDYDLSSARGIASSRIKIIGNIPYNISSPILFHVLAFRRHIESVTLMLQKEVADRIAASPGTKAYGTLSVILQMYFVISREFVVPAGCFYPQPRVDSAVLRMAVREETLVSLRDEDFFRDLVRAAFGRRRKTLFNNLKNSTFFPPSSEGRIARILEGLGIEGSRRGETLTVEEFGRLSNALFPLTISLTEKDPSGRKNRPPGSGSDWDGRNREI